jgi:hypothetical protein
LPDPCAYRAQQSANRPQPEEIEMTRTQTVSPADVEVTGGLMNRLAAIGQCEEPAEKLVVAPLDAPEFMPLGASCQWGALLVLRDFC